MIREAGSWQEVTPGYKTSNLSLMTHEKESPSRRNAQPVAHRLFLCHVLPKMARINRLLGIFFCNLIVWFVNTNSVRGNIVLQPHRLDMTAGPTDFTAF